MARSSSSSSGGISTGGSRDLSRRGFLGSTAALGAAAALPAATSGRSGPRLDELRIGLVGCGGRGTGAAYQALSTKGPIRLVAMADMFEDRLNGSLNSISNEDRLKERVDVPVERRYVGANAYLELIEKADVDVVLLATPPHFRPAHFEAAVKAGKHVFMEKPVAVDGFGIRQVLKAAGEAKAKSLKVGVGLQRHHQKSYRACMEQIAAGGIGRIVAMHVYWNMGALWSVARKPEHTDIEWQLRNWLYFAWLSGDHIVEQHIHNLDVANWAKGEMPVECFGAGGRQVRTDPVFGHIFDHHSVHYRYADGTTLFSMCRQQAGCPSKVSEHLIGSEGRADLGGPFRFERYDGWNWSFNEGDNNPYQVEHDDLFAAIRNGTEYNEAEYGAESTLTAIMGRMATYSGKVISRDQALQSARLGPETYEFDQALPVDPIPMPGL
ncbi:MAG: Gfo/Idh/MocA family oxidoreductase [Planctomycetota bacterium]